MAGDVRGVGNRLFVPEIIANEALARLMDALVVPRCAGHNFQKYFSEQIGDTITIKKPYQARVGTGRTITASPLVDRTIEIQVNKRYNFALKYNDEERTLDIVSFGDRYMQTGVEEIAYKYNQEGADELGNALYFHNGTPGTGLTTAEALKVRAHATEVAIPLNSMNYALMNPSDIAAISQDVKLVNLPPMVSQAIRQRYHGMIANYHIFESVHIPYLDVHNAGSANPVVRVADQEGKSLSTTGWAASAQKILNKGQLFTIAGVHEVQPRGDRRSTGRLQTFTVTEDVASDSSGHAVIPIEPEINDGTLMGVDGSGTAISLGAFQTVDAKPAQSAAIARVGDNNKTYRQNLFFEKQALEYIHVHLEMPESASLKGQATEPQTGLSVTYLADFNITNVEETHRIDSLFGVKTVYPALGIRHISTEV